MRAVRLRAVGGAPEVVDIPIPRPSAGEVRIAVRACGICGSDLHILDGDIPTQDPPLTLGHEAAGVVDEVGAAVTGLTVGDRALINPIVVCGTCRACRAGQSNRCPDNTVLGVVGDGAAADYVLVPAANVHKIPVSIDFATAAIMADAVAGPFHAIREAGVTSADTVAVFGLGGLGLHAVMILKQHIGARVIGVDVYDAALQRAQRFGVDVVVDAREGRAGDQIRDLTGGGADKSFEFVGSSRTVEEAVRCLRRGGLCTVVGVSAEKLSLGLTVGALVANEWSVRGSYGYVDDDLRSLIDLVDSGELRIEGTITHRVPLEQFAEGVAILRDRALEPIRVVVENHPAP